MITKLYSAMTPAERTDTFCLKEKTHTNELQKNPEIDHFWTFVAGHFAIDNFIKQGTRCTILASRYPCRVGLVNT